MIFFCDRAMADPALLTELEQVIQRGSPAHIEAMLKRLTTLFVDGATRFHEDHVEVFDDVLNRLITEIESKARAELSDRLARLGNAPTKVVRRLAQDDNISIAGPVLQHSPRLADNDLLAIAKQKGQAHLLAITNRSQIGEAVTDVIVRRGDREVLRSMAGNPGARLSADGFSTLVKKATQDSLLAEKVGQRPDISPAKFRELLSHATSVVRERLMATAKPEAKAEIRRLMDDISEDVADAKLSRDYTRAQQAVLKLHRAGRLDPAAIKEAARDGRYEEVVAGLSLLVRAPLDIVDRVMAGERPDPVLILCKTAGFGWPAVKSVLMARAKANGLSSSGIDSGANFDRLSITTAQRMVRFWQQRASVDLAD
jgi:uncharacterized protein (DUF2336 family)